MKLEISCTCKNRQLFTFDTKVVASPSAAQQVLFYLTNKQIDSVILLKRHKTDNGLNQSRINFFELKPEQFGVSMRKYNDI